MVNRAYFQCCSCQAGIACRTQFGVGREQTYLFPCPACGVDVGYTLFIDAENIRWRYGDLVNLEDFTEEGAPEHTLNFSSDFIVRKNHKDEAISPPWTPQMENLHLVKNIGEYFSVRNIRRKVTETFWPALNRANTHRARSDRDKFDVELRGIGAHEFLDSFAGGSMETVLAEGFEKFGAFFSFGLESARELVTSRIAEASARDTAAVDQLHRFYQTEDRAEQLFQQLRAVDRQWVALYPFFEPLEIVDCLKDPVVQLSDTYTLSEKPLERLKAFYSDCFETAGRVMVLAACYEGVASGSGFGVPSRRRIIPAEEFERTPNGSKPDLVSGMPFWTILGDAFDVKLRNGIGHHSWHYDASSDQIHYQNHSPSRGREDFSVAYLDFCVHVRKLYHAVSACSRYVHSVWAA